MGGDPRVVFEEVARHHRRCFWLDGGGARDWSGRRSLVGWLDEDDVSLTFDAMRGEVWRHDGAGSRVVGEDPFAVLEAELAAGDRRDQWFGYWGHAARPDLPARPDPHLPDAVWMRPSRVRLFSHADDAGEVYPDIRVSSRLDPLAEGAKQERASQSSHPEAPPADYAAAFAEVQEALCAGDSYEVNLTYRLEHHSDLPPAEVHRRLRTLNPAPYAGHLQHDVGAPGERQRAWLVSSSPERYALVTADRVLETRPIKGTAPRGATPAEDVALRERLATDPKTRAENLMVVDLLRHDLATVCEVGSVEVPALMEVETYPSVHQLVTTVRGRLRDGIGTVAALRALFPAGSMTGAPKLRTMEVIDRVEATPRGVYAGAFGWVSGDGRADLGVVIRSLASDGSGRWWLGTGGAITVRSDLAEEWAESRWKADRLLRVFD